MDPITDIVGQGRDAQAQASKIYGVVIGLVVNNKDEDKLGRVKVKFPWLADDVESNWARLAYPMNGAERGYWWIPEIDDEVLVAFEHGDPNRPYVVGGLYNGVDKPPQINNVTSTFAGEGYDHGAYSGRQRDFNEDGNNDLRFIRSRSGHLFIFDDKAGEEKVTLCDKTGQRRLEIFTDKKKVVITSAGADGDIELIAERKILLRCKQLYTESREETDMKADRTFTVNSKGDMTHKSKANMAREAAQNITEKSTGGSIAYSASTTGEFKAGGGMTVKGSMLNLGADGMGELKAGGILTVKGSMVNIN